MYTAPKERAGGLAYGMLKNAPNTGRDGEGALGDWLQKGWCIASGLRRRIRQRPYSELPKGGGGACHGWSLRTESQPRGELPRGSGHHLAVCPGVSGSTSLVLPRLTPGNQSIQMGDWGCMGLAPSHLLSPTSKLDEQPTGMLQQKQKSSLPCVHPTPKFKNQPPVGPETQSTSVSWRTKSKLGWFSKMIQIRYWR